MSQLEEVDKYMLHERLCNLEIASKIMAECLHLDDVIQERQEYWKARRRRDHVQDGK